MKSVGGRAESCLTELAELLAAVKNRENFDRVGAHAIDQAVRRLDQLADLHASEFRDDAARLRKLARLIKPARDAVDEVLGVAGEERLTYSATAASWATACSDQRSARTTRRGGCARGRARGPRRD